MEFRIKAEMPAKAVKINHYDRIMVLGSCFAQNMGEILLTNKFRCDVNPFGVLYNPISISQALEEICDNRRYCKEDLFYDGRLWHSWMHHTSFSAQTETECCRNINERIASAHEFIKQVDFLIVTWGSAYVYSLKDSHNRQVVGNCHKQKETLFERERLDSRTIVDKCKSVIGRIRKVNPKLKIIITVSPIRHIKDGLHGNQLSKAVLLLAADELCSEMEDITYFPSYEILIDELRDYRFYADDMAHPSSLAVNYIWEQFSDSMLSDSAKNVIKEWESITKALGHRPFDPKSPAYLKFLTQIVLKINQLKEKFPYFDVQKEIEQCQAQLKALAN